jgi:hypothetical protein
MHGKKVEKKRRLSGPGTLAGLLAFVALSVSSAPAWAQDAPVLKPDVPKLDTRLIAPPPSAPVGKPRSALQGKVEKVDQYGNPLGGFASGGQGGGWGRGRSDSRRRMKAGAQNDRLTAQTESGIGIIGVKFVMFIGRPPVINRVFQQTPAYEMGLQVNDTIVAVDGVPTHGLTKEEVYDMIIGTPGTPVTLSIKRQGDFMAVTMTRMDLNDITDPFIRRDYMMSM